MKYLSDYTQEATTALLNDCGAFFAFSDSQFNEAKQEGIKYVSLGAGLICPKEHADSFIEKYSNIVDTAIETDKKENGIENIIKRELNNHEAFYTCDISTTVSVLSAYGVSTEQVRDVYNKTRALQD
jgi:hypothetical protein